MTLALCEKRNYCVCTFQSNKQGIPWLSWILFPGWNGGRKEKRLDKKLKEEGKVSEPVDKEKQRQNGKKRKQMKK